MCKDSVGTKKGGIHSVRWVAGREEGKGIPGQRTAWAKARRTAMAR